MTSDSLETRNRRAPVAQCRLCSAVCSIEAPTTDALRHSLRMFMAEHRHDGLADIVIDINAENDATDVPPMQPIGRIAAGSRIS